MSVQSVISQLRDNALAFLWVRIVLGNIGHELCLFFSTSAWARPIHVRCNVLHLAQYVLITTMLHYTSGIDKEKIHYTTLPQTHMHTTME